MIALLLVTKTLQMELQKNCKRHTRKTRSGMNVRFEMFLNGSQWELGFFGAKPSRQWGYWGLMFITFKIRALKTPLGLWGSWTKGIYTSLHHTYVFARVSFGLLHLPRFSSTINRTSGHLCRLKKVLFTVFFFLIYGPNLVWSQFNSRNTSR